MSAGDDHELFLERALVHSARHDSARALLDVERALELAPQEVEALLLRVTLIAPSRPADALDDVITAARLDPIDEDVITSVTWGRERARWVAVSAASRGDHAAVERALAQAAALGVPAPERATRQQETARIEVLAAELAERPDDLDAHRRMDGALMSMGMSDPVIAMWTRYLARHPEDGAAHLERGGTHFHRRELEAARRDARRACELGVSEGCARAEQLAGR